MPDFPASLETEHLFDADIELEPAQDMGQSPFGRRLVYVVKSGRFEGPKLRGIVLPGGGDWFLALPNGAGELDVRGTFRTHDGALILVTYHGILDAPPAVTQRALAGEPVSVREYYFRTAPRFETGFAQYAWINKTVCVGVGWFGRNRVGYRVFGIR